VLVVGGGSVLFGYATTRPSSSGTVVGVPPPSDVETGVTDIFSEDTCVGADAAAVQIRAKLDALGHSDWTLTRGPGASGATCVGATIFADTEEVVLMMALGPELEDGLDAAAEQLLNECHTKDEAVAIVRAVLESAGTTGWEIRTDGSTSYGPSDRIEEVERHIAEGCAIYAGTGWTAEGARLYWIGGK
jgi:hypothetical protein